MKKVEEEDSKEDRGRPLFSFQECRFMISETVKTWNELHNFVLKVYEG
jgi:hypothetical protein